ncbi:molybdenum transport system permease protein ModB [bacterium BMS3Abin07]|nr:molybdenum transport system permease protein ModB [bacterium BMS3Abin07]GBE31727.1 molybdenum transport system permease protein ModB [bacterium BMS3Bbin05]HDL21345.1 molybdate ABC transporter permease subunit [Nitrospirota bacterium]HDO21294.1 molybdate ABC transporter permease subunit [Nitrospirota bacterium]HDZ88221.1 molybdate ABC transporter permease subunit [Nitrospirota bacterium]
MESSLAFSLKLSLKVASVATLLVMLFGTGIAYVLAKKNFPGKEVMDILLTLPLVMPPTVTGYYLIVIFGRNGYIGKIIYDMTGFSLMFTWYAAVLASFVVALPLMIKTTRAAIESVDEKLINASYTLGRSEFETALKVIFPLAGKGIIAGVVLSFARALGEFGATLMLAGNMPGRTDTMPIAIWSLAGGGDWPGANRMVLMLTFMSVIFLYVANRYSRRII